MSKMHTIAPDIVRKRLMIEGYYTVEVDEAAIKGYFETITKALGLTMYAKPMIYSPAGKGRQENQGYDAFVPLVDSGISLYVWTGSKFLSILIYSCKEFDDERAAEATKGYFKMTELETKSF